MHGEEFEHILASVLVDELLENGVNIDFVGVSLFCHVEQRCRVDPRMIELDPLENIFYGLFLFSSACTSNYRPENIIFFSQKPTTIFWDFLMRWIKF